MPGEYAGVCTVSGMNAKRINSNLLCIFLSLLMILSGCAAIGFDDDEVKGPTTAEEQVENLPPILSIDGDNWTVVSQMLLTISGVVIHDYLSTCRITTLAQNGSEIETIPSSLGTFDIYLGFVDNDTVVYLNVTCGQWAVSNNSIRVRIYVEDTGDDLDGDGVPNEQDSCPEGMGQANGWIADNATDIDGDGCHDGFEDVDDDGDGIFDAYDNFPQSIDEISALVPPQTGTRILSNRQLLPPLKLWDNTLPPDGDYSFPSIVSAVDMPVQTILLQPEEFPIVHTCYSAVSALDQHE